jgi:hypothetical protein
LAGTAAESPPHVPSRFPLAFRPTGLRFLSRPVPPETSAFLTVGPPPPCLGDGLRRGFHVPRMRDAAGVGALYAPGRRCPPGRRETSARRLPPCSGPPFTPLPRPTGGGFSHEASSRVHWCSPVRPSPCLSPPGGTEVLGLLPGASHPTVASDARPGGDGSSDTNPGLPCHRRHRRPPLQEHPLNTRDLVSHLHLRSAAFLTTTWTLDKSHRPRSAALLAYLNQASDTHTRESARLVDPGSKGLFLLRTAARTGRSSR